MRGAAAKCSPGSGRGHAQPTREGRSCRASAVVALLSAVILVAPGCGSRNCRERLAGDKTSPHRLYVAASFIRSCGGDDGRETVTHVNLHAGVHTPRPDLNGLVSSGEIFSVAGEQKINLVWKDKNSLLVECAGCGTNRVFQQESAWRDVQVTYAVK